MCSAVVNDTGNELIVQAKRLVDSTVDAINSVCFAVFVQIENK